jgi:hypothetical protein
MNVTDQRGEREETARLLYDAACPRCSRLAARWARPLARQGIGISSLQDSGRPLTEMEVCPAGGSTLGGVDALLYLARRFWWARPLLLLTRIPGALAVMRSLYGWIARHRHARFDLVRWLPPIAVPAAVFVLRSTLAPWAFMWILAIAIFAGAKWITWWPHRRTGDRLRRWGYLLAWPGLDADEFLSDRCVAPRGSDWLLALMKSSFGALLVWAVAGAVHSKYPVTAGWIGMVGLTFLVHFGAFHLLALAWQSAGIAARPLMYNPVLARSLSDFWSRRWNVAFHRAAHDLMFQPLRRRCGIPGATIATFCASGLVHDLVISVPARAGYGLPTAYFLLQGLGVVFEHSKLGRHLGLGGGWRGRAFALLLTAAPVYWLFHPSFVQRVVLPFLEAIGALQGTLP